jgi:glycosyltransferase involved in cell wall biosynthesis
LPGRRRADILIVSVDSTAGWSAAAADLAASLLRAGAQVRTVRTGPVPRVRTFALTDFSQAWLARRAAERGIAEHSPAAIIYCSITASLLWPRPGAISLDSIAAENRPGRHGVWQRSVERRRLMQAPVLLTWSRRSLERARDQHAPALFVPPPVDPLSGAAGRGERDVDVVTYAGDPVKRRLAHVLHAWSRARRPGESLVVAGYEGPAPGEGVEVAGRLSRSGFHALLSRAKVFVSAPQREDFGIAALEALAAGCMLVTTPAPGPYPALDLARALDARLVSDDIVAALRVALDQPLEGYAEHAAAQLQPFGTEAVDRTVAQDVLPLLMPGWSPLLASASSTRDARHQTT